MSFVDGFYSFQLSINNPDQGIFHSDRIKLPRHPTETGDFLLSRVLAYCHTFRPGLTFSRGLFEPKEPTLSLHDVTGETLLWIDVGCPDLKKLKRALKSTREGECKVYFYAANQIDRFCHYLRGSKSNWINTVSFFLFSEDLLLRAGELLELRSELSVTTVDDVLYIDFQGRQFEESLPVLDMWGEFQRSLNETPQESPL